jgi:phage replication O-like protein O
MRIPAPNYTQSPNVCFDEIFKTLKEGELRVMLVIIRQTFGWHKPFDRISLNQLAEKSGMERKSVCRSLNSLMAKGMVFKRKEGMPGEEKCWYGLIIDEVPQDKVDPSDGYETEEDAAEFSNNSYQCPKDTRPVSLGHQTSVLKTPTKETNPKETIQKKQQQDAVPAAAFFNSSNQKQPLQAHEKPAQPVPPNHSCLLAVDIPECDKTEISRRYDEATVKNAIAWATHPTTKLTKGLAPAIKWACANNPQVPKNKEDEYHANLAYAKKYDNLENEYARVDVLRSHVEIISKRCQKDPYIISYEEKGFKDQINSALRKFGFSIK